MYLIKLSSSKSGQNWNEIRIKINNKGRGISFRLKKLAENFRLRLGGATATGSELFNKIKSFFISTFLIF